MSKIIIDGKEVEISTTVFKPVGCWVIGSNGLFASYLPVFVKPTQEHLWNHLTLLGWEYKDYEN